MNRLLIESVEGRILTGITMFVAVMVLVGWVAINEPARMASFERTHLGRSIERGGELFAANCSTCHGPDALGIAGRAPALRNPQLFGFDFFSVTRTNAEGKSETVNINNEIFTRQRQLVPLQAQLTALSTEVTNLSAELGDAATTEDRKTEINTRLAEINTILDPNNPESIAAQIATLNAELEPLLTERDTILATLENAMIKDYLPQYEEMKTKGGIEFTDYLNKDADRLSQVGWNSDLRSYIRTTLIHGRPGSGDVWGGNIMVAWAQTGGGPLRMDQIEDIVNYILNYDKGDNWTLDDLNAVNQFGKRHGGAGPVVDTVGGDGQVALDEIATLTGDAARGKQLYEGQVRTGARSVLGCSGCHLGGTQAPDTTTTWTGIDARLQAPELAGISPDLYLVTSIVNPSAYVVAPYADGVMPKTFGEQLTAQDLADIVAYLKSYGTPQ